MLPYEFFVHELKQLHNDCATITPFVKTTKVDTKRKDILLNVEETVTLVVEFILKTLYSTFRQYLFGRFQIVTSSNIAEVVVFLTQTIHEIQLFRPKSFIRLTEKYNFREHSGCRVNIVEQSSQNMNRGVHKSNKKLFPKNENTQIKIDVSPIQ